jgi:hypothetical protein
MRGSIDLPGFSVPSIPHLGEKEQTGARRAGLPLRGFAPLREMRTPRRGARRLEYPMYHWLFFDRFSRKQRSLAWIHTSARDEDPTTGSKATGVSHVPLVVFWTVFPGNKGPLRGFAPLREVRTPRRGARRREYPMYHWLFLGLFFSETKVPFPRRLGHRA